MPKWSILDPEEVLLELQGDEGYYARMMVPSVRDEGTFTKLFGRFIQGTRT